MREWQKESCTLRPVELDFETSEGYVIQRKDIVEVEKTDEDTGEVRTEYQCLMRFLTVKEYAIEIQKDSETTKQLLADLTGVVLLGGVM